MATGTKRGTATTARAVASVLAIGIIASNHSDLSCVAVLPVICIYACTPLIRVHFPTKPLSHRWVLLDRLVASVALAVVSIFFAVRGDDSGLVTHVAAWLALAIQ